MKKFGMICELDAVSHRININILLPSYSADVRLWQLGEYKSRETQLPSLINPDWIIGHLGMTTVSIGKDRTKVWR